MILASRTVPGPALKDLQVGCDRGRLAFFMMKSLLNRLAFVWAA